MSGFDYNAEYQEYWSRDDRWGSSSFTDAKDLASRVLKVAGGGSVLDVGCGMGELVHQLLRMGVDASGTDIASRCVDEGNRRVPGRFSLASVLDLPFVDASFETVVCTDMLEHIEQCDIPKALSELARVAKSAVFVCICTRVDRDKRWHLTIKPRDWWEQQFLEQGVRKHSRSHSILDFGSIDKENDSGCATLMFEVMPPEALREFPLEILKRERDLHTDMLREAGRRSDAHVARYRLAAHFVRTNDRVLDVSGGLGYGASIMWENADPECITGVDLSEFAVQYANANYAMSLADSEPIKFVVGDAQDLSAFKDESVDLVVSFETLEHLPNPEAFIAEAHRVLTPGGRFIASIPNDWTDETGKDPNPEHLHVYHWKNLAEQVAKKFLVEAAYSQIAGGGMKLNDRRRSISRCEVSPDGVGPDCEAEWWLIVGMKDPVGAASSPDANRHCEVVKNNPQFNVVDFAKDYDNPWLVRSMVSIGLRAESDAVLKSIATRVLGTARAGSPDEGAALCVLAYQHLSGSSFSDDANALLAHLRGYHVTADDSPHGWRWRVSNQYVSACLLLKQGRRLDAKSAFEECAAMDPLKFGPLLATKTVASCFEAGMMAIADGERDKARTLWCLGIEQARKAVSGDWLNILGDVQHPLSFGLAEACQILDGASRCSWALLSHQAKVMRAGYSWTVARNRSPLSDLQWLKELAQAKDWHESQHANWRKLAIDRERDVRKLAEAAQGLQSGKDWLEAERNRLSEHGRDSEDAVENLRSWIDEQEVAKQWLDDQRKNLLDAVGKREQTIEELREWIETQDRNNASQVEDSQRQAAKIKEISAWADEQEKGNAWLDDQRTKLLKINTSYEAQVCDMESWIEKLEEKIRWAESQRLDAKARSEVLQESLADSQASKRETETKLAKLRANHASLSVDHYGLVDSLVEASAHRLGVRKRVRELIDLAADQRHDLNRPTINGQSVNSQQTMPTSEGEPSRESQVLPEAEKND